ncbi:hypothetical protein ABZ379_31690 [Streptomyces canus]|uniref:hypothetical protein n=1 Tax=Streptomyces canus TaxID=58343 RepID=UPI0033C2529C
MVIKRKVSSGDAEAVAGGDYATIAKGVHPLSYGDWCTASRPARGTPPAGFGCI